MGHRTTNEEARQIIRLYESGKSFKEIREITGRSKEAQIKVLGYYGLYEPRIDELASYAAEILYNKEVTGYDCHCGDCGYRKLSVQEQSKWVLLAKKQCIAEAKARYDILFCNKDDQSVDTDMANDPATTSACIKVDDLLEYCSIKTTVLEDKISQMTNTIATSTDPNIIANAIKSLNYLFQEVNTWKNSVPTMVHLIKENPKDWKEHDVW